MQQKDELEWLPEILGKSALEAGDPLRVARDKRSPKGKTQMQLYVEHEKGQAGFSGY